MKTGLVYGDIYLNHDTGPHHPERAQRLTAILETLESTGLLDSLLLIEPVPAEKDIVKSCHDVGYIETFKHSVEGSFPFLHTPECPLSPGTFEAAPLCCWRGTKRGRQCDGGQGEKLLLRR